MHQKFIVCANSAMTGKECTEMQQQVAEALGCECCDVVVLQGVSMIMPIDCKESHKKKEEEKIDEKQLEVGKGFEMQHTSNEESALRCAKEKLANDPDHYKKLTKQLDDDNKADAKKQKTS